MAFQAMLIAAWIVRPCAAAGAEPGVESSVRLQVPLVVQTKEHCGPAALAMVLGWYDADSTALAATAEAYDQDFRGALITDLAARARRSGFVARVATLPEDSLAVWLRAGVPPVVLYSIGIGPLVRGHYAVVVGWDPERRRYELHDGGPRPRWMSSRELRRRWRPAGSQALIIQRPA